MLMENTTDKLSWYGIAINLQFVKKKKKRKKEKEVSAKPSTAKCNKLSYACNLKSLPMKQSSGMVQVPLGNLLNI